MAHRLSSSLYEDGNKMSKGQEMYLKRMKKSGKWIHTNQVDPGRLHFCLRSTILTGLEYELKYHMGCN